MAIGRTTGIRGEVASKLRNPLLEDRFRNRYYIKDDNGMSIEFPGFSAETLDKNLYFLINNSDIVPFKRTWRYRPDYASFDLYGSTDYWQILLFTNRVTTIEEFKDLDELLVPSLQSLIGLTEDLMPSDPIFINTTKQISSESRYFKLYSLGAKEQKAIQEKANLATINKVEVETPINLIEITQNITLTTTDIDNTYVDLSNKPINFTCLTVTLNNFPSPLKFGSEYMLAIFNNVGRIHWSNAKTPYGVGMTSILVAGDILTVVYLVQS